MNTAEELKNKVLSLPFDFNSLALEIFQYQAAFNTVYKSYLSFLKIRPDHISSVDDIPFLPIGFFKSHDVICLNTAIEKTFTSSGSTGQETSRHLVSSLSFYKKIFMKAFEYFYGDIKNYVFIALLPSYLERTGSSLVYMAEELIEESKNAQSGFYLNNDKELYNLLINTENKNTPVILLGVTYALLDFAEKFPLSLKNTIVMETGGMKGKRKEMVKEEIHSVLKKAYQVDSIHSEYGMTELLSQAYSKGDGKFLCPPWMQVVIKEINDPLGNNLLNKTGAINIMDLANVDSCSFIATQDLGKKHDDGSFEVLGRFDHSDLRGCNLMVD